MITLRNWFKRQSRYSLYDFAANAFLASMVAVFLAVVFFEIFA